MGGVYVVDTEQTGLPETDPQVIELAWLKLDAVTSLQISDSFLQRYCPSKPSTFGAMAVHHILPFELEGCPPSSEATLPPDCEYLIAHSADYDWQALGSPPNVRRICTRAMVEHVWPDADSYSQVAMLYLLLGPTEETRARATRAHSAQADVENNLTLLRCILRKCPEIDTWAGLWEFSEECRIPLKMPITDMRGQPISSIDDGLLEWCLSKDFIPQEHPYFYKALLREYQRRQDDDLPF